MGGKKLLSACVFLLLAVATVTTVAAVSNFEVNLYTSEKSVDVGAEFAGTVAAVNLLDEPVNATLVLSVGQGLTIISAEAQSCPTGMCIVNKELPSKTPVSINLILKANKGGEYNISYVLKAKDEEIRGSTSVIVRVCGDNECVTGEAQTCCRDCGCPSGQECVYDRPGVKEGGECFSGSVYLIGALLTFFLPILIVLGLVVLAAKAAYKKFTGGSSEVSGAGAGAEKAAKAQASKEEEGAGEAEEPKKKGGRK